MGSEIYLGTRQSECAAGCGGSSGIWSISFVFHPPLFAGLGTCLCWWAFWSLTWRWFHLDGGFWSFIWSCSHLDGGGSWTLMVRWYQLDDGCWLGDGSIWMAGFEQWHGDGSIWMVGSKQWCGNSAIWEAGSKYWRRDGSIWMAHEKQHT